MAIMNRLTRLFRADVHAVLDRMEEPEVLLRQALREMEDEVVQGAKQLKSRELERQQVQARLGAIELLRQDIGEQLDLCFASQNEAIARTLLRRRLEGERMTRQLGHRLAALHKLIAERGAQLDEQRASLEGMRQKADVFQTESAHAQNTDPGRCAVDDFAITEADIDLALLREQQQRGTP